MKIGKLLYEVIVILSLILLNACTFHGHKDIPLRKINKVPQGNHIVIHNDYYRFVLEDVVFSKDRMTGYKVKGIGNKFNDFHVKLKNGSPLNSDSAMVSLENIEKIMFYVKGLTHEVTMEEFNSIYRDNMILVNDGYGSFLLENAVITDGFISGTKKKYIRTFYKGMNRIVIALTTHYKLNSEKVTILFDDIEGVSTYAFEPGKTVLFYTGSFAVLLAAVLLLI